MQSLHLHMDAAEALGFGAMFGNSWFNGSWPEQIAHMPITFKETILRVVHIINKQSCKETYIMRLVRPLVLTCMKYNILSRCVHVSGKYNILPDLLSRLQVEEFHRPAQDMNKVPTRIPTCLLEGIF